MKSPLIKKQKKISDDPAKLRRRAEAQLRKQLVPTERNRIDADTHRLLHELEVHQIELRMQNAELHEARDEIELALEKYTDLYDFAPVGYFSLDEQGLILEVNLRGAAMLGVERSQLVHRRLQLFVSPADRTMFLAFLEKVFAGIERPAWEGSLLNGDGDAFRADFKAAPAASLRGARKWCRVAILMMPEEAQRRMDALATNNRELNREIARREAMENALQKSERHQRKLLGQSRSMQEQLRHLSHQILHAQEEERKRISRELHDEIAQTLVGINVHLEALTREATDNPKGLKQKITRTQRLVEESVEIVHRFARELRPTVLDDLGLIPALHSFMKEFMKRTGVRVRFTTFAGVEKLNNAQRTVLFRVAQEALTNVARHAQATRVEASIQKLPDAVRMQIKDNGKAFVVEQVLHAKKNKSLGLLGIRERLEMVGGSFDIASAPGEGTAIQVQIPLGPRGAGKNRRLLPQAKNLEFL
jgi:PAS domain S-box-containing protein